MAAGVTPPRAPPDGPLHALEVLEFFRVLELVSEEAMGPAGAAAVRALRPLADPSEATRTLRAVDELRALAAGPDGWRLGPVPDLAGALRRLQAEGATLDAETLIACATACATARAARGLQGRLDPHGAARAWFEPLWGDADLEARIGRTFDESGGVSDDASPELRRIRRRLGEQRARLVERLERYARELPERVRVADASVTIRNGRYCIPIRREGKSGVGGLVHDASASRQTLFVEPPLAIEAMNEIRELELDEAREIERILAALSGALRDRWPELRASYEALVELDSLAARAIAAARWEGFPPRFATAPSAPIRFRGARHPLLAMGPGGAIPFDLDLAPDERVLLVSGPNAGGKTVLLKSIGLIGALAQSGVVPPVGPETGLPFFEAFYAVIGDEQSIDASLSTFGAQARNLAEILRSAGPRDLVLIDEIGSATDPAEGGALAAATLKTLARQARLTVATTHLGDLKRLGEEVGGTVNASLQFDSEHLEPTYRLVRDRPGRSYALEIAARLGVPEAVLADARARLDDDHRSLDALLARLESERAAVTELRARLDAEAVAAAERAAALAAREAETEARARAAERAREAAREEGLREGKTRVEAAIEALEARYGSGSEAERRDAQREARSAVEGAIRESRQRTEQLARARAETAPRLPLGLGERVRWRSARRAGTLIEIRGDRGVVEVDGLRLTAPLGDLVPDDGPAPGVAGESGGTSRAERRPELSVRTEIDLRGLRVEEVDAVLVPALDAALVAELPWLRIIHGKGTGALRERVRALLEDDPRIPAFRSGEANEGGTGVTVAELR